MTRQTATHRQIACASAWLEMNRAELVRCSPSQIANQLLTERDIVLPVEKVEELCGLLEVAYRRPRKVTNNTRKGRQNQSYIRVVAKSLKDLMERLGEDVPEQLRSIAKGLGLNHHGDDDDERS